MSGRFRRLRACIAIIAMLGTFGVGMSAATHLVGDDDAACGLTGPFHGPDGARLSPARAVRPPTHCPFCHWQRAVGGAAVAAGFAAAVHLAPIDLPVIASTRAAGSAAIDERPSRAPPALS